MPKNKLFYGDAYTTGTCTQFPNDMKTINYKELPKCLKWWLRLSQTNYILDMEVLKMFTRRFSFHNNNNKNLKVA